MYKLLGVRSMVFSNIDVPLLMASLSFIVVCLLSLGILIHLKRVNQRREMIEKIRATDGEDYVSQDLCIRLLADEEGHLIQFRGFLKEYLKS